MDDQGDEMTDAQVVLAELRDVLPEGTVVDDANGIRWTRVGRTWESGTSVSIRPPLPLTIVSEPEKGLF